MEVSVQRKMAELRSVCARDIEIQQGKVEAAVNSFGKSLKSIKSRSEQTVDSQVKLGRLKAHLRQVEDQLVKVLAVKTRKEAKRMAIVDSISVTKAKIEELHRVVRDQKERKDMYAEILSHQLEALAVSEEKIKQSTMDIDQTKAAFAWYNDVLGFRIEGGQGVKFTFTNINKKCPNQEYSFTVRHANDVYSLLDCKPQLNEIKELVHDLNKNNDLFKFVRIMRAKFRAASTSEYLLPPLTSSNDENAVELSLAGPMSMASTDNTYESPAPLSVSNRDRKETGRVKTKPSVVVSPTSALSRQRRRSPRFIGNTR